MVVICILKEGWQQLLLLRQIVYNDKVLKKEAPEFICISICISTIYKSC